MTLGAALVVTAIGISSAGVAASPLPGSALSLKSYKDLTVEHHADLCQRQLQNSYPRLSVVTEFASCHDLVDDIGKIKDATEEWRQSAERADEFATSSHAAVPTDVVVGLQALSQHFHDAGMGARTAEEIRSGAAAIGAVGVGALVVRRRRKS